jgi:hypothetical protein
MADASALAPRHPSAPAAQRPKHGLANAPTEGDLPIPGLRFRFRFPLRFRFRFRWRKPPL